jgi:hypothetical protein
MNQHKGCVKHIAEFVKETMDFSICETEIGGRRKRIGGAM